MDHRLTHPGHQTITCLGSVNLRRLPCHIIPMATHAAKHAETACTLIHTYASVARPVDGPNKNRLQRYECCHPLLVGSTCRRRHSSSSGSGVCSSACLQRPGPSVGLLHQGRLVHKQQLAVPGHHLPVDDAQRHAAGLAQQQRGDGVGACTGMCMGYWGRVAPGLVARVCSG